VEELQEHVRLLIAQGESIGEIKADPILGSIPQSIVDVEMLPPSHTEVTPNGPPIVKGPPASAILALQQN
jgi:hypothetical protein